MIHIGITRSALVPRLLMLVWAGGVVAAPMTFDDAASLDGWAFSDGPEFPGATGRIAWNAQVGHARPGALELQYSFAEGGNYVQAACTLPADNDARVARLWLNKPGKHRITIRATDAGHQTFQKGIDYACRGWQQIEVDLTRWAHSFGGPADGKVRPPIQQFGILIENNAEPRQGTLLIDDVEFIGPASDADAPPLSTYVVCDFTSAGGWGAGGGPGNRREGRRWQYAFNANHGPPTLTTDFSLLGEPARLRLILDGDGSGHDVHLQIASHFQVFQRRIGQLTTRGRQVLEVPLGDMSTWQHFGGQNDGQVRWPLRMKQIRLDRATTGLPTGPPTGTLTLERMEIDTALPEKQHVLLVPDVRHDDDTATFSVQIQNLRPRAAKGRLACDIRTLADRIERQLVELALPPAGGGTQHHEVNVPIAPHHFLEASFQWIEPDAMSPPVSIGMSTLPAEPGSAELDPSSPIGAGLYLYRWHADPQAHERISTLAALAQRSGVKWTREEISWEIIEPQPGQYHWSFYDDMIRVARAHGISVYGLLCYWAPWSKAYTPEGIEQYCAWVRQVVRRYKADIQHWEIWNEPNIFFWSGPKEMYASLLERAYETIKGEDPDAVVLGCSTSGIDIDFIKSVMARGAPFDALTIHPYRGVLDDLRYIEELRHARQLVDGRPVWITEIGFPSQLHTGYSERRQASLVARVYLASLASGAADNVAWYDFRNDGRDPYYNEMNFGLVRSDFRPKPGYRALATIGRTLAGFRVAAPIDVGPGAYAFRFTDGRRDVVAACAPDAGRVLTFRTDADVEIINAMGEPIEPVETHRRDAGEAKPSMRGAATKPFMKGVTETSASALSATLDTGFPVYITSRAGFAFEPLSSAAALHAETTHVRAGQQIEIRISPALEVSEWDLPAGWDLPTRTEAGTYTLTVSSSAAAADVDIQAIVPHEGKLRLPLSLSIHPNVIRF